MSEFLPVAITGPARAQSPAKFGAKYFVRLNPLPSREWIAAFDRHAWELLALREQPPRIVFYGDQNERVGIGLSSRVVEAPSMTISVLMDALDAAVEEINLRVASTEAETAAREERLAAEASERQAEVEARIAADWSVRQRRS